MDKARTVLKPSTVPKYIDIKPMFTMRTVRMAYTGTCSVGCTLLMIPESGSPRSLAKEKTILELWAIRNTKLIKAITVIKIVKPRAPPIDPVACWKIAIKGTPVEVFATCSRLPMQNMAAMRKAKPVTAPIQTDQMIALGAVCCASWSSSAM